MEGFHQEQNMCTHTSPASRLPKLHMTTWVISAPKVWREIKQSRVKWGTPEKILVKNVCIFLCVRLIDGRHFDVTRSDSPQPKKRWFQRETDGWTTDLMRPLCLSACVCARAFKILQKHLSSEIVAALRCHPAPRLHQVPRGPIKT